MSSRTARTSYPTIGALGAIVDASGCLTFVYAPDVSAAVAGLLAEHEVPAPLLAYTTRSSCRHETDPSDSDPPDV